MKAPNKLRTRISELIGQRKLNQARAELIAANTKLPDNAEILLMLGSVDMMMRDFLASKAWFEKSNQVMPNNPICLVQLGSVCQHLQKVDEAISYFKSAIAIQPDLQQVRIFLGQLLLMNRDQHGAIEQLELELQLRPDNPSVLANLAQLYDQVNQYDKAAETASLALKLLPEHIGAMTALANVEKYRGNYTKAEILYRRIAEAASNDTQLGIAQSEIGHVLDRQGRFDEAFQAFEDASTTWKKTAAQQGINAAPFQTVVQNTAKLVHVSPDILSYHTQLGIQSGPEPLFFVGFPRSGTTLVEQILEQHPKIVSSREYPIINHLCDYLPPKLDQKENIPVF